MIVTLAVIGSSLRAQNLKFGHINSQELLKAMPENDSAQVQLQRYAKQLQDQMDELQVEYNRKLQDYQAQQDQLTDLIRKTKEQDLIDLQKKIQDFQVAAQQDMQKKQQEMLQPIIDKANNAIKEVARENGFIYIFDVAGGTILYYSEKSVDILPLVKKKLGIE
jgi:outer membrane protein